MADENGEAKDTEVTVSVAEMDEFLGDAPSPDLVFGSVEDDPTVTHVPETVPVPALDSQESRESGESGEGKDDSIAGVDKPTGKEPLATDNKNTPVASTEQDVLKAQVAALTALVDKLSVGPNVAQPPSGESQQVPPATMEATLLETFKDLDIDAVLDNRENFLKFMATTMEVVRKQTREEVMAELPSRVEPLLQRQQTVVKTVEGFYSDNPELQGVKQYVSYVAKELAVANPEWDMPKVLSEAAIKVKSDLQIKPPVNSGDKEESTPTDRPTFPGGTRSNRMPTKTSSTLADEVSDLIFD